MNPLPSYPGNSIPKEVPFYTLWKLRKWVRGSYRDQLEIWAQEVGRVLAQHQTQCGGQGLRVLEARYTLLGLPEAASSLWPYHPESGYSLIWEAKQGQPWLVLGLIEQLN